MPYLEKLCRPAWRALAVGALLSLVVRVRGADDPQEIERKLIETLELSQAEWKKAGSPSESSPEGEALMRAAVHAGRADVAEAVLAGGDVMKRMIRLPRGGRPVKLRAVHSFKRFQARLHDEMFAFRSDSEHRWLARRLTADAIEVWTPNRGWLFDGKGRLLNEARPPRGAGHGRQWYGAFLPDGRWVTTDVEDMDGVLRFFSAGQPLRSVSSAQLAPPPEGSGRLIGWARSDRAGTGWVVNVGSEEGYATVWVGPDGPARILKDAERWRLCHPRTLGPRGWSIGMSVPDDSFQWEVSRGEAGHGPGVGFPMYEMGPWGSSNPSEDVNHCVPEGNYIFGFWPGKRSYFVGADGNCEREAWGMSVPGNVAHEASGLRARKFQDVFDAPPVPIIDKTWFFDDAGKLQGWLRARRMGDASDGRGMLFRVTADSRIAKVGPDLRVKSMRRMVWKDGATADAVTLWDDLRMGLFIRNERLVLASWDAR